MQLSSNELYRLYEEYNSRFFANQLPESGKISLSYSKRLIASAGICYPRKRIIRLSLPYHEKFPEEVGKTLLHEMIHLIAPNHGAVFKSWMYCIQEQGGHVDRHARERATEAVWRWNYTCCSCGKKFLRKRRLSVAGQTYRCGTCRGELREERIKL